MNKVKGQTMQGMSNHSAAFAGSILFFFFFFKLPTLNHVILKLKHVSAFLGVTAHVYTSVMLSKWILNCFLVLIVSIAQCRDTGKHMQACTSGQDKVLSNVLGPLRNRILLCSHAF